MVNKMCQILLVRVSLVNIPRLLLFSSPLVKRRTNLVSVLFISARSPGICLLAGWVLLLLHEYAFVHYLKIKSFAIRWIHLEKK